MLPSEAPMPPCAATVCERVGNTLDSTATFRPASDSCSDARMPEPPAPTITTSNLRLVRDAPREGVADGLVDDMTAMISQILQSTCRAQPAQPTSQAMAATCNTR